MEEAGESLRGIGKFKSCAPSFPLPFMERCSAPQLKGCGRCCLGISPHRHPQTYIYQKPEEGAGLQPRAKAHTARLRVCSNKYKQGGKHREEPREKVTSAGRRRCACARCGRREGAETAIAAPADIQPPLQPLGSAF